MKIFITRELPGDYEKDLLSAGHEFQVAKVDRPLTQAELIEAARGVDGLITLLTDKIDGEVIDAIGPQLKIVSNYAVGFDNIDIKAASDRLLPVTNTPSDEVNEAVAEHTWALILALTRRIVEADEATRRGAYKGWEPHIFIGPSLVGKTLGIIGMGRIGSMVARRAKGFGVKILYFNRKPDPEAEKSLGVIYTPLEELLAKSDVVSLHVPLTEETRHMINKESIAKMKDRAYIVNTARGPVINEEDLVDALRMGKLAGASLDVFDNEPNINPELISMPNVITTPHIASATREAREKMSRQAVEAVVKTLSGVKPENLLNVEIWDTRRK